MKVAAESLQHLVADWYGEHARDLPWRSASADPWSVMVSEFMLQQTPVARVLPVYEQWLARWPAPAGLAGETPGEAVRAWGRLGYPRRALRLHGAATAIVTHHGGRVPETYANLRSLPGVGDYTAAAISAFAFGHRQVVLDTNVRRVLARLVDGRELPAPSVTRAERDRAERLVPRDGQAAARWSVGVMELGALVCTATDPACHRCPLADACAWLDAGRPADAGPPRRRQTWAGTDRQCRGRLMAVLRDSEGPVHVSRLDAVWTDAEQRTRCLASLIEDGLCVQTAPTSYALP